VAVLTAGESMQFFGVLLESKGIQPVWLRVDNRNDYVVYIVPRSADPNYYSAYEAAYVNHRPFSRQSNEAMDEFFQWSRIRLQVPAHQTNRGFLFPNLSEGTKFVNIEMVHDQGAIRDGFFFQLPNGAFDYEQSRVDPGPVLALTLKELRQNIETLPCCTTDATGAKIPFAICSGWRWSAGRGFTWRSAPPSLQPSRCFMDQIRRIQETQLLA